MIGRGNDRWNVRARRTDHSVGVRRPCGSTEYVRVDRGDGNVFPALRSSAFFDSVFSFAPGDSRRLFHIDRQRGVCVSKIGFVGGLGAFLGRLLRGLWGSGFCRFLRLRRHARFRRLKLDGNRGVARTRGVVGVCRRAEVLGRRPGRSPSRMTLGKEKTLNQRQRTTRIADMMTPDNLAIFSSRSCSCFDSVAVRRDAPITEIQRRRCANALNSC